MDGRKDADNTKIISLGLYQTEYNVDTDHMTRNWRYNDNVRPNHML